jgi:hypothetical protein
MPGNEDADVGVMLLTRTRVRRRHHAAPARDAVAGREEAAHHRVRGLACRDQHYRPRWRQTTRIGITSPSVTQRPHEQTLRARRTHRDIDDGDEIVSKLLKLRV